MLFVTLALLVADLALQPGIATPAALLGRDKIEHLGAFLALMLAAQLGWPRRTWLMASVLLGFGIGIELAQASAVAGRTGSAADVVADLLGIALGLVCATPFRHRKPA